MNITRKYLSFAVTTLVALILSSCVGPVINSSNNPPSAPASSESPTAPAKNTPSSQSLGAGGQQNSTTTASENTVSVTIYKADSECKNLIPEKVDVPVNNSLEATVGKFLYGFGGGDFDVAGYRVLLDTKTGTATVDLRLNPNSPRQFISLSSCEQFALFGALNKTLISNSRWKIKSVRFTDRGKLIEF